MDNEFSDYSESSENTELSESYSDDSDSSDDAATDTPDDISEDNSEDFSDIFEDYSEDSEYSDDLNEDSNTDFDESSDNQEDVEYLDNLPEDTDEYDDSKEYFEDEYAKDNAEDESLSEIPEDIDDVYDDYDDSSENYELSDESDIIEEDTDLENYETLSDYMNAHNYDPSDYDTYSQDPVWRELMRQEYPDQELPDISEESANAQLYDYMTAHNYGIEDYDEYSQDPVWRELHEAAYPDDELPPLEDTDNLGEWDDIPPDITPEENLDAANPNYELGEEWQTNCQRCVPTYEMRERGYDVTAMPCTEDDDYLSYHPFDVWENPDIIEASDDGSNEIQEQMAEWGDGARAQVVVEWENGDGGHTFIAEQRDGKTVFIDPQSGETDVDWYFDEAKPGATQFCRIDNIEPSSLILDCCEKKEAD